MSIVQSSTHHWYTEPLNYLAIVAGWIVSLCGGWDFPLRAMLILRVLDYIGAILVAYRNRKPCQPWFDPQKAEDGAVKTLFYGMIIIGATALDSGLGLGGDGLLKAASVRSAMFAILLPADFSSLLRHGRMVRVGIPNVASAVADEIIRTARKSNRRQRK